MPNITPQDIISQFSGQPVNMDHLARCAHKNGSGRIPEVFIVYSCGFLYDAELRELFGVTDKLKDLWERRGIEFNVCLYITDGQLVSCAISKYTESGGPRPSMTTPKCTQQELRVARRILQYTTV